VAAPVAVTTGLVREADLYAPVKAFLEAQGWEVKGEVRGCDIVATRGDEAPIVVELKQRVTLALVLQGVDRLAITERVYLAVARPRRRLPRAVRALCRRLGLGLLTVTAGRPGGVEVVVEPAPYRPRLDRRRRGRVLAEHVRRVGDPTPGGVSRTPIMTAYRQEALRCAVLIRRGGPASLATLRGDGLAPNAARIVHRNVYGWFVRTRRATYGLTTRGLRDLEHLAPGGDSPVNGLAAR
jgi:hypothetical protein